MKTNQLPFLLIYLISTFLLLANGCQAIGGIFKAGIWVGVIGVAVVVGLIFYIISRFPGGKQ